MPFRTSCQSFVKVHMLVLDIFFLECLDCLRKRFNVTQTVFWNFLLLSKVLDLI